MLVRCYDSEFEISDMLIDKFLKDFNSLPGSGQRESICQIRKAIDEVVDVVAEDPEMLEELEYRTDFCKALAMKQALKNLGILYDA